MTPLRDHIHARFVPVDRIGSIHLAQTAQNNVAGYKLFDVLAVGPGRLTRKGVRIPVECTAGDRIVTLSYTTGPVELKDGTSLLTEDQVLMVVAREDVKPNP